LFSEHHTENKMVQPVLDINYNILVFTAFKTPDAAFAELHKSIIFFKTHLSVPVPCGWKAEHPQAASTS